MNNISIEYASLSSVDPQSVSRYLASQGWEETKGTENSSLWQLTLPDHRRARILLPLDNTISDFRSRMYDLIRVISKVEDRPEADVLTSIRSASNIAENFHRDVINLRFTYEDGEIHGMPTKKLGTLLVSFQALINAIAQYEEGIATELGPIPTYVIDKATFSMMTTFKGSFGITLTSDIPEKGEQGSLLEEPLARKSLRSLMDLIRSTTEEEKLKEALIKLKKRAASGYRNFLIALSDAETDNIFEWGCPGNHAVEMARLSRLDVLKAVAIATKTATEEPTEIDIDRAEWIGGNSRREDFEIKDLATEKSYTGKIAPTARKSAGNAIWHGIYTAKILEEIELIESTQQVNRKYTLLFLEPLMEGNQKAEDGEI